MDIREILNELGLEEYLAAFERHRIDGDILASLTSQDLADIGIEPLGDRKRVLNYIAGQGQSAAPRAVEQRRPVTVLFADLVGSTGLSQTLDSEDMRHLIRTYHAIGRDAAVAYEGRIVQFLGDGIYAYFGHPRAHQDDPERAVRMGLHLIEEVAKLSAIWSSRAGRAIEVRVGIESGRVVVGGAERAEDRQSVLLTGEAPNVAAHLQAAAAPCTIAIGPQTAHLLQGMAETEPLPADTKIPEGSARLLGLTDHAPAARATGAPFVGRKDELGTLRRALADVRTGHSRCVAISGEAGIGKSRLVQEFVSALPPSYRIYSGSCASLDGAAYHLVRQMLRLRATDLAQDTGTDPGAALAAELAGFGDRMSASAPYLLHVADLAPADRDIAPDLIGVRVREGLAELARASGEIVPTILYFNDLHWIDERSQDVLSHLLAQTHLRGVLILLAFRKRYRPDWLTRSDLIRLDLPPLDTEAAAELFERLSAKASLPDGDLLASTGGNPYFISELARMEDPGVRSDAVPFSLQSLMQERIDRLSPRALALIRAASAAGRQFQLDDLMAPGPDRALAVSELEQHGYVQRADAARGLYRFTHALLQESVYAGLVREDLAEIHQCIADRIEGGAAEGADTRSEELARHFRIGGAPLRAARYAFLSGQKASAVFALKDASQWFESALSLLPETLSPEDLAMRREAISQLINIRCWSAEFSEMVRLAESVLDEFDRYAPGPEAARFRSWLAEGYTHNGRLSDARAVLEDVLKVTEGTDDRQARGLALAQYAWLLSLDTPSRDAGRRQLLLGELEALARDDPENQYAALMLHYAEAAGSMHAGDYTATRVAADAMIALGETRGYPPANCWGHCFRAFVEADAGNASEANDHCRAAAASALCVYDQLTIALCEGSVLHRLGRRDEALDVLDRLRQRIPEAGMFHFSHLAHAAEGHARLMCGDPGGANLLAAKAESYLKIGYQTGAATVLMSLGDALLQTGAEAEAAPVLQRAADIAAAQGMKRLLAQARAGLGLQAAHAGRAAEAEARFAEALELAQSLGWFPLEQRIRAMRAGV